MQQAKQQLFCPGPVNLHHSVKHASIAREIGHREPEFSKLLQNIQKKLLALYGLGTDDGYHAVVITGSGTAANEAMLSSIVGSQNILVLTNGEFGERLFDISSLHNRHTKQLRFEWGQQIDLAQVEAYLKLKPVDIIAMVHHETSTGMLNPVKAVGRLAARYGKQFVVDTVSSAGAEILNLKECHVTFCSSSASKAICSVPGVSFVVGKVDAFERLAAIPARTMYLNLYRFYTYSKRYQQTPNTPAVQSFFALDQALTNLLRRGLAAKHEEILNRAIYLRQEMKKLGLNFLLPESQMSCVLTTVFLPNGIDATSLRKRLRQSNIIIYGGKGPLADKVFQVSNIGELTRADIKYFLSVLAAAVTTSPVLLSHPTLSFVERRAPLNRVTTRAVRGMTV